MSRLENSRRSESQAGRALGLPRDRAPRGPPSAEILFFLKLFSEIPCPCDEFPVFGEGEDGISFFSNVLVCSREAKPLDVSAGLRFGLSLPLSLRAASSVRDFSFPLKPTPFERRIPWWIAEFSEAALNALRAGYRTVETTEPVLEFWKLRERAMLLIATLGGMVVLADIV